MAVGADAGTIALVTGDSAPGLDMPMPPTSLLDAGNLPVGALAAFAKRESRRPRPIYGAHKWFARRLGTAFRALLAAAATPEGGDFWAAYYGDANLQGWTVLDTFVGGGTALVEAQRMGASVIGFDVDPVATAVTGFELGAQDMPDPEHVLAELQERVGRIMAPFHLTTDPDGSARTVVHHFWVQVVNCRGCGLDIQAHPTWQLASDQTRKIQWVVCRSCGHILERPLTAGTVRCSECHRTTRVAEGHVHYGTLTCPQCRTTERLIDVADRTQAPPTWTIYALEVLDTTGPGRRVNIDRRSFRRATPADRGLVDAAEDALRAREAAGRGRIPADKIPESQVDNRLRRYGYRSYRDLFNPRQLLHLSLLGEAIENLPEPYRTMAGLAMSNHLTTTCMLTSYAAGWRRLAPLFTVRAFRHVPRPVEVNPWLRGVGRGTYPNALRQVAAAVRFAQDPRELTDDGFEPTPAIAPRDSARVYCQSSEHLENVATGSVTLVLSDPPYLDNIAYSELSDFFAPWMRQLGLTGDVPSERARASNLAAGNRSESAAEEFARRLGACFAEAERVLAPGGRVVFTYQHATAAGWHALAQALATTSLRGVTVLPLQGDGGFGLHAHEGNSIFDAILVLKGAPVPISDEPRDAALTITAESEAAARARCESWCEQLATELPGTFRAPDATNLLRAHLAMAALNDRFQPTGAGRPLADALEDVHTDPQERPQPLGA